MKFEASFFFKQNYCHTSFAVFFAFPRKFTIIIDYRWLTSFPGFSPTSLPRRRSFGNSPTRSACFAPTRSVGTNWRDDWERGWWDNYHLLGAISTVFFFGCIAFFRDQNVRQKKRIRRGEKYSSLRPWFFWYDIPMCVIYFTRLLAVSNFRL